MDMGPCVDEEVQVFRARQLARERRSVSLAQLEVEGTELGSTFAPASAQDSRDSPWKTVYADLGFKSRLVIAASASTRAHRAER